jgi:hypothetical protein
MAKEKKATTPKAPKAKKLSRQDAANRVVMEFEGRTTLGELAAAADALVVEAGGKSNPRAAAWFVKRALESAAAFGLLTMTRPTDVIVVKAGA